jgi:hypothetical protein
MNDNCSFELFALPNKRWTAIGGFESSVRTGVLPSSDPPPGSRTALRRSRPLGTGREGYPSYGSSLSRQTSARGRPSPAAGPCAAPSRPAA